MVSGTLGAAVWQDRSSELAGLIVELTTAISSEINHETQMEALRALRAVALSLSHGLASDSLPITEEEDFQDVLAATLTFVSEHQAVNEQEGLDPGLVQQLAHQVLLCLPSKSG